MKIWKYTLNNPTNNIMMPKNAKILDVQIQHNEIQMWALVNENNEQEQRDFSIFGTGNEIPDDPGDYIATFQLYDGKLVFHVFEDKRI